MRALQALSENVTDDDEGDNEANADLLRSDALTTPPSARVRRTPASSQRMRQRGPPQAAIDWLLKRVDAKVDDKGLFALPDGVATKGLRDTGDGIVTRHALHIATLDHALKHNDPRTDVINAARTTLDDALARLQQRSQDELAVRMRSRKNDGDAEPVSKRTKPTPQPKAGVGYESPSPVRCCAG